MSWVKISISSPASDNNGYAGIGGRENRLFLSKKAAALIPEEKKRFVSFLQDTDDPEKIGLMFSETETPESVSISEVYPCGSVDIINKKVLDRVFPNVFGEEYIKKPVWLDGDILVINLKAEA